MKGFCFSRFFLFWWTVMFSLFFTLVVFSSLQCVALFQQIHKQWLNHENNKQDHNHDSLTLFLNTLFCKVPKWLFSLLLLHVLLGSLFGSLGADAKKTSVSAGHTQAGESLEVLLVFRDNAGLLLLVHLKQLRKIDNSKHIRFSTSAVPKLQNLKLNSFATGILGQLICFCSLILKKQSSEKGFKCFIKEIQRFRRFVIIWPLWFKIRHLSNFSTVITDDMMTSDWMENNKIRVL